MLYEIGDNDNNIDDDKTKMYSKLPFIEESSTITKNKGRKLCKSFCKKLDITLIMLVKQKGIVL